MKKLRWLIPIACSVMMTIAGNQYANADAVNSSKIPQWFLNDVKVAETAKFPIRVDNYGIELIGHTPFNLSEEWVGGFNGTIQMKSYNEAFYWQRFSMTEFYRTLTTQKDVRLGPVHSVFILEQSKGGMARWVHAEAINVGTGGFLAYADNQIITNNDHGGFDSYTVIPLHGITIP